MGRAREAQASRSVHENDAARTAEARSHLPDGDPRSLLGVGSCAHEIDCDLGQA